MHILLLLLLLLAQAAAPAAAAARVAPLAIGSTRQLLLGTQLLESQAIARWTLKPF
jgi:hypothetical protein